MANQIQSFIKANRAGINHFAGKFNTNGAGAITLQDNTAAATAARTAVGKITVTFPEKYQAAFGYGAQLTIAVPDGSYALVDSFTLNSSGKAVMVIGTYSAAHAAADSTGVVTWHATVKR